MTQASVSQWEGDAVGSESRNAAMSANSRRPRGKKSDIPWRLYRFDQWSIGRYAYASFGDSDHETPRTPRVVREVPTNSVEPSPSSSFSFLTSRRLRDHVTKAHCQRTPKDRYTALVLPAFASFPAVAQVTRASIDVPPAVVSVHPAARAAVGVTSVFLALHANATSTQAWYFRTVLVQQVRTGRTTTSNTR